MSDLPATPVPASLAPSLTRRNFLRALPAGGLILSGTAAGCSVAGRSFYVEHFLKWIPQGIFHEIAFSVVDGAVEFVDAYCEHCRKVARLFMDGLEVYGVMTIACPECGVMVRLATAGSRLFLQDLVRRGFDGAVGLAAAQNYKILPVGPVDGDDGPMFVSRSSLCDDVQGHEPVDLYDRSIPFVPQRLVFFTDVRGLSDPTRIHHVWRVDGEVTDRIPLQICYGECGRRFRTYSRKHNLRAGAWIVTAENRRGEVLASRTIALGG